MCGIQGIHRLDVKPLHCEYLYKSGRSSCGACPELDG
jgi:hypothetical protein